MKHPDDVNGVRPHGVINNVAVDAKGAVPGTDLIASLAQFRMTAKLTDASLQFVKVSIRLEPRPIVRSYRARS